MGRCQQRHPADPGKVGIFFDSNGWTSIDKLVDGVHKSGFPEFDQATLYAVVESYEKKRFTMNAAEDRRKISRVYQAVSTGGQYVRRVACGPDLRN